MTNITAEQAFDDLQQMADGMNLGKVWYQDRLDAIRNVVFARKSIDVDWLAQVIRKVDGNNSMGAGALAEAIVDAVSTEAE